MILITGLDPVFTGGSGATGGSEKTGDAATGTFAWATCAASAAECRRLLQGGSASAAKFSHDGCSCAALGFGLGWLVLSRVTHYAEVVGNPATRPCRGHFKKQSKRAPIESKARY